MEALMMDHNQTNKGKHWDLDVIHVSERLLGRLSFFFFSNTQDSCA